MTRVLDYETQIGSMSKIDRKLDLSDICDLASLFWVSTKCACFSRAVVGWHACSALEDGPHVGRRVRMTKERVREVVYYISAPCSYNSNSDTT
jgi:hypothetical protein